MRKSSPGHVLVPVEEVGTLPGQEEAEVEASEETVFGEDIVSAQALAGVDATSSPIPYDEDMGDQLNATLGCFKVLVYCTRDADSAFAHADCQQLVWSGGVSYVSHTPAQATVLDDKFSHRLLRYLLFSLLSILSFGKEHALCCYICSGIQICMCQFCGQVHWPQYYFSCTGRRNDSMS